MVIVNLEELMPQGLIQFELKTEEKMDAIHELAKLMADNGRIDNLNEYIEAVTKREEEYTTGIGFGVGIPHGKSSAVQKASLAFGRSKKGISWDSMDGKPVNLLFLIAVSENTSDEHLKILSMLSRKLMHQSVRDKLMTMSDSNEIYEAFSD